MIKFLLTLGIKSEFLLILFLFIQIIQLNCFGLINKSDLTNLNLTNVFDLEFQQNDNLAYLSCKENSINKFIKINISSENFNILTHYQFPSNTNTKPQTGKIISNQVQKLRIFQYSSQSVSNFHKNGTILSQISILSSSPKQFSQILISQQINAVFMLSFDFKNIYKSTIRQFQRGIFKSFYTLNNTTYTEMSLSPNGQYINFIFFRGKQFYIHLMKIIGFATSYHSMQNLSYVGFKLQWRNDSTQFYYKVNNYQIVLNSTICSYNIITKINMCFSNVNNFYVQDFQIISQDTILMYMFEKQNYLSNLRTQIRLQLINTTDLTLLDFIDYTNKFTVNKVVIKNQNQTIQIAQISTDPTQIKTIKKCQKGEYYDDCKSKCMIYHQLCVNQSKQGCQCMNEQQQQPQQTQENKKNFLLTQEYKSFLKNSLENNVLQFINQIPGIRSYIKSVGSFFIKLDDLWLYYYHSTNYGQILQDTFKIIKKSEQQKWKAFGINQNLNSFIIKRFEYFFNFKLKYTSSKYFEIQGISNQFYQNILSFIYPNIFIIVITFIITYFIKQVCSNFNIYVFKEFLVFSNFIFMILEGNVQFFSFLIGFELKTLFTNNFIQRLSNFSIICLFFLMIFFLSTIYFLLILQKKNIRSYFFNNIRSSKKGALYLTFQKGLKNVSFGFVHLIIGQQFGLKILVLLFLQLFYLLNTIYHLNHKIFMQKSTVIFIDCIGTLVRINLFLICFLYKNYIFGEQLLIDQINSIILRLYIVTLILGFFIDIISQIIILIYQKIVGSSYSTSIISFSLSNKRQVNQKNKKLRQRKNNQMKIFKRIIQLKKQQKSMSKLKQNEKQNQVKLILNLQNTNNSNNKTKYLKKVMKNHIRSKKLFNQFIQINREKGK